LSWQWHIIKPIRHHLLSTLLEAILLILHTLLRLLHRRRTSYCGHRLIGDRHKPKRPHLTNPLILPCGPIFIDPPAILHQLCNFLGEVPLLYPHLSQLPLLFLPLDILDHALYGLALHDSTHSPALDCGADQLFHAGDRGFVVTVVFLLHEAPEVLLD
jgi:hypothetical protein